MRGGPTPSAAAAVAFRAQRQRIAALVKALRGGGTPSPQGAKFWFLAWARLPSFLILYSALFGARAVGPNRRRGFAVVRGT